MTSRSIAFVGEALPGIEVCSGAEHLVVAGYDDAFYARVEGEEVERCFEGGGHGVRECVVFSRAVQGDEDYGCGGWRGGGDVGETDVWEGEGGVGGG